MVLPQKQPNVSTVPVHEPVGQCLKELGDHYLALEDRRRARECYQQASVLAPNDPGGLLGLGTVAMEEEDLQEAAAFFGAALRLDPRCSKAYGGLAMVHQQRREFSAAQGMYLKCLELDCDNLAALLGLFQTCCQMRSFETIIHYLEIYLQMHPGDASVLFCLATLYARDGRLMHARRLLLEVLRLEPDKTQAAQMLAQVESAVCRGGEQVAAQGRACHGHE